MTEEDYVKFGLVKNEEGKYILKEQDNPRSPFFCQTCRKVMRPMDTAMWLKLGVCTDCQATLETHILATGGKLFDESLKKKILNANKEIIRGNKTITDV